MCGTYFGKSLCYYHKNGFNLTISIQNMNGRGKKHTKTYFYRWILKWTVIRLYFAIEWDWECLPDKKNSERPMFFRFATKATAVVFVPWPFTLLCYMDFLHFINIDLVVSAITCDKCTSLYANAHNENIISSSSNSNGQTETVAGISMCCLTICSFIRLLIYYAQKRLLPFYHYTTFWLFQACWNWTCTDAHSVGKSFASNAQ